MNCQKCGMSLPEGSLFCSNCGNALNNDAVDKQINFETNENDDLHNFENSVLPTYIDDKAVNVINEEINFSNYINDLNSDNVFLNEKMTDYVSLNEVNDATSNNVVTSEANDATLKNAVTNEVNNVALNNVVPNEVTEITPNNIVSNEVTEIISNNVAKKDPKNNKNNFVFIAVGLVGLLLIIIGVVLFMAFSKNPKNTFDIFIDKTFDVATKYLQTEQIYTSSQNFDFKFELDLDDKIISKDVYQFINNFAINGNLNLDYTNKLASMDFGAKYKNSSLADVSFIARNNSFYTNLGDLYDKNIEIPVEKEDYNAIFNMIDNTKFTSDSLVILTEIKNALKDALKEEYFKKEKTVTIIDGKEVKTTQMSLVIGEKEFLQITKDLLTTINNDDFINSVYNLYTIMSEMDAPTFNKEDIKNGIVEMINNADKQLKEGELNTTIKAVVSLYLNNKDIVKLDLVANDTEKNENMTILDISKLNGGVYSFNMVDLEKKTALLTGTININENAFKIKLEMIENEKTLIELNLSLVDKQDDKLEIILDLFYSDLGNVKLIMDYSQKYNQTLTIPTITNKVLYTELSEQEVQNILLKLIEKESVKNLVKDTENLLESFSNY